MQDILDLAEQDGCEDLKYDAYGSSVRLSIQKLFSIKEEKKMRSLTGQGRKGLMEHLDYVVKSEVKHRLWLILLGLNSFL